MKVIANKSICITIFFLIDLQSLLAFSKTGKLEAFYNNLIESPIFQFTKRNVKKLNKHSKRIFQCMFS